jgi:hypothetical protein
MPSKPRTEANLLVRARHHRSTVVIVAERGCDFCRDDQNMYFGHLEQVAASDDHGILLRCPQCAWLYLDPGDGSEPRHIDAANALSWFGHST